MIIGAAGGVGSVMTQLARQLTGLIVIGMASRPEAVQWVRDLCAHHVIDNSKPLAEEVKSASLAAPDYVVSLTNTEQHLAQIVESITPQGKFGLIDDPFKGSVDIGALKAKALSLRWELMFTCSLFQAHNMIEHHNLLTEVANLVDAGQLKTTLGGHFGAINSANLKRAHAFLESGRSRGRFVLKGF